MKLFKIWNIKNESWEVDNYFDVMVSDSGACFWDERVNGLTKDDNFKAVFATGFVGNNGVPIYQNDIVSTWYTNVDGVVCWRNGAYYVGFDMVYIPLNDIYDSCKVIGSLFELNARNIDKIK